MSALDRLLTQRTKTGTPEHRFVEAVRAALKAYDRVTKVDLRRFNGKRARRDGRFTQAVQKAVERVRHGASIRAAARAEGVSYGTVWNALKREGSQQA
jgi:hypothetical protein